jgi:hypothetical protein
MNEYQVVYTDDNGNQETEVYQAESLTQFKGRVKSKAASGYGFFIYQMIPVHTDWDFEFEQEKKNV